MNYRVFESKWRSWFTRLHVCLSIRCFALRSPAPREPRFEVASPASRNSLACDWRPLKNDIASSRRAFGSRVETIHEEAAHCFPGRAFCVGASAAHRSARAYFFSSLPEPQIRRDHPQNLSLSISGGRETNQDSPSNGMRSGKSSSLKPRRRASENCGRERQHLPGWMPSNLTWKGVSEKVRAPCAMSPSWAAAVFGELGCLGMQPKAGGKLHLKLNNGSRPIANKYCEGKVKSTLKRYLKNRKTIRRERMQLKRFPSDSGGGGQVRSGGRRPHERLWFAVASRHPLCTSAGSWPTAVAPGSGGVFRGRGPRALARALTDPAPGSLGNFRKEGRKKMRRLRRDRNDAVSRTLRRRPFPSGLVGGTSGRAGPFPLGGQPRWPPRFGSRLRNWSAFLLGVGSHLAPRLMASEWLHPTHLETRTKEYNTCANLWVANPKGPVKAEASNLQPAVAGALFS